MRKRGDALEVRLKVIATSIKTRVLALKEKQLNGDTSAVLAWILDGRLACAPRPLRYHHTFEGSGRTLPGEARPALNTWISHVKGQGIRSIVCMMCVKETAHYVHLIPEFPDIIEYYRHQDFEVVHLPWSDPAHTGFSGFEAEVAAKRPEVLQAYDSAPKPVLIHCSAAIDRSPPVVAYVVHMRGDRERSLLVEER